MKVGSFTSSSCEIPHSARRCHKFEVDRAMSDLVPTYVCVCDKFDGDRAMSDLEPGWCKIPHPARLCDKICEGRCVANWNHVGAKSLTRRVYVSNLRRMYNLTANSSETAHILPTHTNIKI